MNKTWPIMSVSGRKFDLEKAVRDNFEQITKEKIQEQLITLRHSGDADRDAELYDLIRRVGKL